MNFYLGKKQWKIKAQIQWKKEIVKGTKIQIKEFKNKNRDMYIEGTNWDSLIIIKLNDYCNATI